MKNSGVLPDQLILATVLSLSACGHDIRHLRTGRAIHSYMLVSDILISAHLSSALINLYATCANMEMAEKLYNGMPSKDLVHTEKLRLLALYLCEHGNWEHGIQMFYSVPDSLVLFDLAFSRFRSKRPNKLQGRRQEAHRSAGERPAPG